MSSKREITALTDVLADPENENLSADEVAERCIDALDAARARTHRVLVVGQIEHAEAPGTVHTVALGPFSSRGVLDSPEKFRKATEGGTAAREAGQGLAWDSKTGKGWGRFMLVPVFRSARDAWNFHRGESGLMAEPETWAEIADNAAGIEPVCVCGLIKTFVCRFCGREVEHYCQRHEKGTQHRCGVNGGEQRGADGGGQAGLDSPPPGAGAGAQ